MVTSSKSLLFNCCQDLKSFIDSSNGTIYVSFGTNVNTSVIPEEVVQIMVKVFSRLPYRVLWKWDQDKLPGKPENIKISKHFPQANLLSKFSPKIFNITKEVFFYSISSYFISLNFLQMVIILTTFTMGLTSKSQKILVSADKRNNLVKNLFFATLLV